MLINLNNHPFKDWNRDQQNDAVSRFGAVVDMPFPAVPPEADTIEIDRISDIYLKEIKNTDSRGPIVVHIMGEMTFCYALICKLRQEGIRCVASTSKRLVHLSSIGEKIVDFNFVRFRDYK